MFYNSSFKYWLALILIFIKIFGATNPLCRISILMYLGPLHTQAKSRDHEIVTAQTANTPPNSCSVVTNPQV